VSDDTDDTDGGYDIDSGVLEPSESLDVRGVADVLDEGISPVERPWAINDWGLTAREAAGHEDLSHRLARELPEVLVDDSDGIGDTSDTDGEPYDNEVGTARAGRLIEYEGSFDDYQYQYAVDVGVDGSSASSEEAAVHLVADDAIASDLE
jgi:hypothetical protein